MPPRWSSPTPRASSSTALDRLNPARLVVDSLSELRLLAQTSLRYRRQILALKQLFLGRTCTVVMLDDRTAEGPDLQLHSIAHGVISLESRTPAVRPDAPRTAGAKVSRQQVRQRPARFQTSTAGASPCSRDWSLPSISSSFRASMIASGVSEARRTAGRRHRPWHQHLAHRAAGLRKVHHCHPVRKGGNGSRRSCGRLHVRRDQGGAAHALRGARHAVQGGLGAGELNLRQIDPAEVSPGEFVAMVRRSVEEAMTRA